MVVSAAVSGNAGYVMTGGALTVTSGYAVGYEVLFFEAAQASGSLVEIDLELPVDARVERVSFAIAAEPGGFTTVGSVAAVRSANTFGRNAEAACTVDFGRLVTVGGVGFQSLLQGASISGVHRWTGSTWSSLGAGGAFAEVATDRLLIETDNDDTSGDELAEIILSNGGVRLPAVPTLLELLVDGVTIWFERQGSAPGSTPTAPSGGVAYQVDRTDLVRTAFGRATAAGGTKKVRVALRSSTPGLLTLQPEIASLRVHTVQFPPDGLAKTVQLTEEGPLSFDVSPPASATEAAEVAMVVRGSFGPDRVQPAAGPALEPDAALVLVPARPVLFGLPTALVGRFGELGGLRLNLSTAATGSGAELSGRLLADVAGKPGDALPGTELTALSVQPGANGWHTLTFAEAVELTPTETPQSAWLELQLSYGEVECALTLADPDDPAPGAPLLRRLPGGGSFGLTTVPAIGALHGAIRLVGRPDADHPIPAVIFAVPRGDTEVAVTPTGDNLTAVLALAVPVKPAEAPAGAPAVELTALVAAAGSLTVDTVTVAYREGPVA